MSVVMLVILFSHQASAVDLCGVGITYPGATITTNNNPCITVNSVSINASGITSSFLPSDELKTYKLNSTTPIIGDWQNQSSTYSQWLVTSPNPDTHMYVTNSKLGSVSLNYLDSSFSFANFTNIIAVNNAKFIQLFFNASSPIPTPQPAFAIGAFNQSAMIIPWKTVARNSSNFDVFVAPYNNGTITAWYHTKQSATVLTNILGSGNATYNLGCTVQSRSHSVESNGPNVYYLCPVVPFSLQNINILTGGISHNFSMGTCGGVVDLYIFLTEKFPSTFCVGNTGTRVLTGGNFTVIGSPASISFFSNEKISFGSNNIYAYNTNSTGIDPTLSTNPCELINIPTNKTVPIDNIACDSSYPANVIRYWNGMAIQKVGNFYINSTTPYFSSINTSPYKTALSLTGPELGISEPFSDFILKNGTINYMVVLTPNTIYYVDISNIMNQLNNFNRAVQTYTITLTTTDSNYNIPNPAITGMLNYGPSVNQTLNKYGMYTLISGYTMKEATQQSAIRTIDPQWTNTPNTNIPVIATDGNSLFPVILTVANAPLTAALKVTNPYQVIGGVEGAWSITRLDSTHTAEFDITPNQCANIYVADATIFPYLYLSEGNVCATGTNQKTIAFTNTLPINFWTFTWGATHSFTPATNALQTIVRHSTAPYTYTVVVYNSTGAPIISQAFTGNGLTDTRNFNVSGVAKPGNVQIIGDGSVIYSAYLGSSVSLASAASFFHTYFSYQGFDFLSFIPIIFAAMFSRNTVGIGAVLVVVLIATLSWLSIVVIPDQVIFICIVVAIISMIGYRSVYG